MPAARTGVEETMARQIRNAADAGNGDAFLKRLQRDVAAKPDDLSSRLTLAKYYAESGNPELALDHYRNAYARFPDSADLVVRTAKILCQLDLPNDARLLLEEFTGRHPDSSAEAWGWLGMLQDEAHRWSDAERSHRAAVALDPRSDSLHNNLGYNLLLQGKNAAASEEFRKALEIAPQSVVARNNLGLALADDPKDALEAWKPGTDPASAHNNLAAVLIEQRRFPEARKQLQVALGYNKDHAQALRNLQLVDELDRGGIGTVERDTRTGWDRVRHGLRLMFLGEEEPHKAENAVNTASHVGGN